MQQCYAAGCIEVGRVALVDDCTGEPIAGASNGYTFGGITALTWEPVVEEGTDTTVKDMCGNVCMKDVQCDQTTGYNVEITLCRPDNELVALLTGEPIIVDGEGNTVGYFQTDDSNCAPFVSLELFERIPDSQCSDGVKYRRIIFPKIRITQTAPEREGPIRLLKLGGTAESSFGSGWADGPFNDSPVNFATSLGPNDKFFISEVYEVEAPSPSCGYTEVPGQDYLLTSTAPCTIHIAGPGLDTTSEIQITTEETTLQFFAPDDPNFGSNPIGTVINQWDDDAIDLYSPDLCGQCVTQVSFFLVDHDTFSLPTTDYDPCVNVSNPPTFADAFSPECNTIRIEGTDLDQFGYLTMGFTNGSQNAYGPLWPNEGPDNAVEQNTIISWSSTVIEFSSPGIPTGTSLGIAFFDPSSVNTANYNNSDLQLGGYAPFNVVPCPTVDSADSLACEEFEIIGTGYDNVNHITVNGSITVDYYDPAGPDNGLNPGTATITTWDPTLIDITDTQWGGETITDVDMFSLGDAEDYGNFSLPDFDIDGCSPTFLSASSPGAGQLQINGTNLTLIGCIGFKNPGNNAVSSIATDPNITTLTDTIIIYDNSGVLSGTTITEIFACTQPGCDCIDFATNPGNAFDVSVSIPIA